MSLQSATKHASRVKSSNKRHPFGMLLVLLLLVTGLGARELNTDALWFDEVWSLHYAGGAEYGPISVDETVSRVVHEVQHEGNPPGYYVLLNLWGQAVGWTEYAMRGLSLLGGIVAVACTYRLGYDITASLSHPARSLVGLSAATAVGLSAFYIHYLHELRAYSIVVSLAAFDLLIYHRIVYTRRQPSYWLQAGLVLGVSLSLYFHYLLVLILGMIALYHLLIAPRNPRWWRIVVLGVLGLVLFMPWVWTLLRVMEHVDTLQEWSMRSPQALETLMYVFSNGSVALLALLGVFALRAENSHGRLLRFLSVIGLAGVIVLSDVYPIVTHIRYLIMLWPLLALLVGVGIEQLSRRSIGAGWILGIWIFAGLWNTFGPAFSHRYSDPTRPWREFHAELQTHGQPDDLVVFESGDRDWYRQLEMDHYMSGLPMRYSLMEHIPGLKEKNEYYDYARQFISGAPRVWVGVDQIFAPNFRLDEFQRALAVDYIYCWSAFDLPEMRFGVYAHVPDDFNTLPFRFGDDIRMQLLEPLTVSGNRLSVLAGWYHGDEVPLDIYSVALHVVDSAGNLVTQADYGLPADSYACHAAEIHVSSGTYTLMAAVYRWQTGERLVGVDSQTGSMGDRISLGTFTVP